MWYSIPSSPGHATRYISKCGRIRRSPATPGPSGKQSVMSMEFVRKMSWPPGRSSRAASGIHLAGSAQSDAPYSENARSNDESGSGTSSPGAWTSGNSSPVCACMRRAVASCAGVGSTPTGRAPSRASRAEKYAVPQPSSTTSRPSTSPRQPICDSGMPKTPHWISPSLQCRSADGSVNSEFVFVHCATFAARESCEGSGELIGGEPKRDLARRGLGRVGAVHEVVRHRHREIAADRARVGVCRVRRADRLAHRRDRSFAFHDERPGRAGGDEVDELAVERLFLVLRVVLPAELSARCDELAGAHVEAARLDAAEDLTCKTPPYRVRLDQDQGALGGHRPRSLVIRRGGVFGARAWATRSPWAPLPSR